jgi:hypothetical protein
VIVNELTRNPHPDFNDMVIHFTGRAGVDRAHPKVARNTDEGRLLEILRHQEILGFEQPGTRAASVCFTEATSEGCAWMIGSGRYTSCGVAFSKQYLFRLGGGPALQIRGDEWHHVTGMPPELRARTVRLWPGARQSPQDPRPLPWWLEGRSEWSYEREWRLPCVKTESVVFERSAVQFLVVPSRTKLQQWVKECHSTDPELADWLASTRFVVLSATGIDEANGVAVKRSSSRIESDGS